MREFLAIALFEDHHIVGIRREALGRVSERQIVALVAGEFRHLRPDLRHQDIARHHLIAHFGADKRPQQRLPAMAWRLAASNCVRSAEFTGSPIFSRHAADDFRRVVHHRDPMLVAVLPEVTPSRAAAE